VVVAARTFVYGKEPAVVLQEVLERVQAGLVPAQAEERRQADVERRRMGWPLVGYEVSPEVS
jgi:hypothetical protein